MMLVASHAAHPLKHTGVAAGFGPFLRCCKFKWRLGSSQVALWWSGGKGQSRGQALELMGHLGEHRPHPLSPPPPPHHIKPCFQLL